ncbi:MAG: hypothetical protein ACK4L7_06670, partial [Flavobacteriales bacterium]
MESLAEHTIAFTGLKDGQHRYEWLLGQSFFDAAQEEELAGGHVAVSVTLDKTPSLLVANIHVEGT